MTIEKHYGRPMDVEWGATASTASSTSAGATRTVKARKNAGRFRLKKRGDELVTGAQSATALARAGQTGQMPPK